MQKQIGVFCYVAIFIVLRRFYYMAPFLDEILYSFVEVCINMYPVLCVVFGGLLGGVVALSEFDKSSKNGCTEILKTGIYVEQVIMAGFGIVFGCCVGFWLVYMLPFLIGSFIIYKIYLLQ